MNTENKKYQVLNEITDKILDSFEDFNSAADFAYKTYKLKKNQPIVIKESNTNKIISRFGILND